MVANLQASCALVMDVERVLDAGDKMREAAKSQRQCEIRAAEE